MRSATDLPTMLSALIPNFQAELEELRAIGSSGFILGFNMSWQGPEYLHSEYPVEWRAIYEARNYFVGDPILMWQITSSGDRRWSEINLPDPRGVMREARGFGLNFGAVFSRKVARKRSFMTLSRPDRELTDAEMQQLATKFTYWVDLLVGRASLSDGEVAVLKAFRDGLGQRETARFLEIAESTVKQRAIGACKKLGAATRTQAVAIALTRNYLDD